jgi:hypothetical protein
MEPVMGIAALPAATLIGFASLTPCRATGQSETLAGALGSVGVHWTPTWVRFRAPRAYEKRPHYWGR